MSKINSQDVCIILLNYNNIKETVDCLDSLKKSHSKNFYVLIVDNGSKNNEAEKLKSKYGRFVTILPQNKNYGFAEGNNIGIRYAIKRKTKYIFLLNNDTIVPKNFLEPLIKTFDSLKDCAVLSPQITSYGTQKIWSAGGKIIPFLGIAKMIGKGEPLKLNNSVKEVPFVTGCCFFTSAKNLIKIGLLDSKFFYFYEDADWCFRAKKYGLKSYFLNSVYIEHKASVTTGIAGSNIITPFKAYYLGRNAVLFAKKNFTGIKKYWFIFAQYTIVLVWLLLKMQSRKSISKYFEGLASV